MHHLWGLKLPHWKCMIWFINDGQEEKEMRKSVANWLESTDWQTALAGRWGDSFHWKKMGWPAGGEKAAQALENVYLNWLTVFGDLDLGALVLPNDGGGRWTGHITNDVSIIAFVELLRAGSTLEGDLFCGRYDTYTSIIHAYKYLNLCPLGTTLWEGLP